MSVEITEKICKKYITLLQSAKGRGIEFNLTYSEVKQLVLTKRCSYSGILLVNPPQGKSNNLSFFESHAHRTIDRIDRNKGYVSGNVVACCHAINCLKANLIESCMPIDPKKIIEFSNFPLELRLKILNGLIKCGNTILTEEKLNDLSKLSR